MRFHFVIRTGDDIILPGMSPLMLHEFHHGLNAQFSELNGAEIVNDYGDWLAEHAALRESAGVIDLSFRSRICLTGADRVRFLHGQVTNDVKRLQAGEGCYAVITTAKGKMESDLNIFGLADELLLDFEPGLTGKISARLEKFIVADDVQIVDAAPDGPQVHQSPDKTETYPVPVPPNHYTQMQLFLISAAGPTPISVKLQYIDGSSELRTTRVPDFYFLPTATDKDWFILAEDFGKVNLKGKMTESVHHYVHGFNLHPDPAWVLKQIRSSTKAVTSYDSVLNLFGVNRPLIRPTCSLT